MIKKNTLVDYFPQMVKMKLYQNIDLYLYVKILLD